MTRIAIIGSSGQLGSDLARILKESFSVVPLDHTKIECTDAVSVGSALRRAKADVVVNCAAFVRVDDCEDRVEEAFRINALGALHIARSCHEMDAFCVYVSTDFVFDGEKGEAYAEDDFPRPINAYGVTKLAGEWFTQQNCPSSLIVRMSSLFGKAGARGKGGNFVDTILAKAKAGEPLRVVDDIVMSPTYTCDAARALRIILERPSPGIVHLANRGHCSWFEFAKRALELAEMAPVVEPVSASEYPTRAPRPRNSALCSLRMDAQPGLDLQPWEKALRDYLQDRSASDRGR